MPNETLNVDEPEEGEGASDLVEEITRDQVALEPAETGDPASIVEAKIPADVRERYEVYSYRNAAAILCETRKEDFEDLLKALRAFKITTKMIRTAGGNESDMPKLFSSTLRPLGWYETVVQGDLLVKLTWREQVSVVKKGRNKGRPILGTKNREIRREKYLDGHKIDYVKNRVAFDLEWNSKDQTFDRDLYAFRAFFECGVIDAAVLVTRSKSLDPVFRSLGQALKKDGITPDFKSPGVPRLTHEKYGASTTWIGKLLYRLNAGRNGGCPVLVVGITPKCLEDWKPVENETQS
ncbi:MAG: BglII/BstYI family type II restriction endonuclease [Terracidiphilus sp.]